MTLLANKLPEGELRFHSYSNMFELLEGEEFDKLVADIKTNGQLEPIWLYQGMVLDGRNRLRACQQLDLPPTTRVYEGKDPIGFVWSVNSVRRHLNETQRGIAGVKMANMRRGGSAANPSIEGIPKKSQADAAKTLNVSVATVERASALFKKGAPEVVKAAQKGEIRLGGLGKLLRKTKEEQQKLITEKGSVKEALKAAKAEPSKNPRSKTPAGQETESSRITNTVRERAT